MTKVQRLGNIVTAIVMIIFAILLALDPVGGIAVVASVFSITFTLRGFQGLLYYFSMARSMVGGKAALYRGIIMLEIGIFTATIVNDSSYIIILYVAGMHAFSGLIDVLRAREAKAVGASWRFTTAFGVTNILMAVMVIVSGIFMNEQRVAIYVYAAGLLYSAILRIASALRRTAIIYIQ